MYAQDRKTGKPNNLKIWEQENQKEPKHDSHNLLRSPMPEGGKPLWEVWRLKILFNPPFL